jgi:hypothetical protein
VPDPGPPALDEAGLDRLEAVAALAEPRGHYWSTLCVEAVPALVAEVRRLRAALAEARARCEGLAERVAQQSELLSRRAERPG